MFSAESSSRLVVGRSGRSSILSLSLSLSLSFSLSLSLSSPSSLTAPMAHERDETRRWPTQCAFAVGGAAALLGIYLASTPAGRVVETNAEQEEAGILNAIRNAGSSLAADIRQLFYSVVPGAAPPASMQQVMFEGARKRVCADADEGARVRTRCMCQVPDTYGASCISPLASASSSCQALTAVSTAQPNHHNFSGKTEFERLVEAPIRDRSHLLELLAQVEASHEEGCAPVDTIFLGEFKSPTGAGRFSAKATIVSIEKAIGEVTYNFRVAWADGDQSRTKLRGDKGDFVKACVKSLLRKEAASPRAAASSAPVLAPATPTAEEGDSTSAASDTQIASSASCNVTVIDSMTTASRDAESADSLAGQRMCVASVLHARLFSTDE